MIQFATYREMAESQYSRKIIGFDAFGKFPIAENSIDQKFIEKFESECGDGIPVEELRESFKQKGIENYELIRGDIIQMIPKYLEQHKELKIALLHIDVDAYEPTKAALEYLFSHVVQNGIIMLDDYNAVHGATMAVNEFIHEMEQKYSIQKLSYYKTPSFIEVR